MSLINDALKKAQRQRNEDPAGGAASVSPVAGSAPRVAPRRQPMPAQTLVLLALGFLVVLVVLGGGAFYVFQSQGIADAAQPSAPTESKTPAVAAVAQPVPAPGSVSNAVPSPGPNPNPESAPPTVTAPVAAAPTPTPEPTPAPIIIKPPARPDPHIMTLVETFRVTGIRASATDPKVLMNDRVFRLNDVVDRSVGLRLTGIETDRLTFVDEAGAIYEKSF